MDPSTNEKESKGDLKKAFPATKRNQRSAGRGDIESIDLDVTPMMNVMLVLIPFLVSMAVFTNIAVIDFSLPPASGPGGVADTTESKELDISIVITGQGFRIVGSGKKLDLVPQYQGQFQWEILRAMLKEVKFQYPSQKSVILVLDGNVLYDDVIHFMDICRESQFPDIALSGEIG
jgi:biopolymer transport protein ExbD